MKQLDLERTVTLCGLGPMTVYFGQPPRVHAKHVIKHVLNPAEAWQEVDQARFPGPELRTARERAYATVPRTIHDTDLNMIPDAWVETLEPVTEPFALAYAETGFEVLERAVGHSTGPGTGKDQTLRCADERGLIVRARRSRGKVLAISTVFRVRGQNTRERASRAVRKVRDVPSFYTTSVCRPPERQQAPHTTTTTIAGRPT